MQQRQILNALGYQLLQSSVRSNGGTPVSIAQISIPDNLKAAIIKAFPNLDITGLAAPSVALDTVQGKRALWQSIRPLLRD